MKNILKNILTYKAILFILVLIMPVLVQAQTEPGGDPDVPIDGGLSLLIAGGVGYGMKKLRKNK
jgi:hypothetical protein